MVATHKKQSLGQRRVRPKTALPSRPTRDIFEAVGPNQKERPTRNLEIMQYQNFMNTSNNQVSGQQQAPVTQTQAKPQWFDNNSKPQIDDKADVASQQQDKEDALPQGPTDYHQLIIENYFDDGRKPRDHSKEMMNLLEKKYLNTNIEEYLAVKYP